MTFGSPRSSGPTCWKRSTSWRLLLGTLQGRFGIPPAIICHHLSASWVQNLMVCHDLSHLNGDFGWLWCIPHYWTDLNDLNKWRLMKYISGSLSLLCIHYYTPINIPIYWWYIPVVTRLKFCCVAPRNPPGSAPDRQLRYRPRAAVLREVPNNGHHARRVRISQQLVWSHQKFGCLWHQMLMQTLDQLVANVVQTKLSEVTRATRGPPASAKAFARSTSELAPKMALCLACTKSVAIPKNEPHHIGVSINGGTPKWMVYSIIYTGKSYLNIYIYIHIIYIYIILKLMIRGYPISGNSHMLPLVFGELNLWTNRTSLRRDYTPTTFQKLFMAGNVMKIQC